MESRPTLAQMVLYFLKLGATGFGGPVALANYMRTDLVERAHWLSEEEYNQGLAIATACPGPLAYQLGVFCGYIRYGVTGGIAIGLAFAAAPFLIVLAVAALYSRFSASRLTHALFYGVGPVVVGLILRASWNLGTKTLKREWTAWTFAVLALAATLIVQRELTLVFIAGGVLGIFVFRPPAQPVTGPRTPSPPPRVATSALPLFATALPTTLGATAWKLFAFFFKTGFLVFGSGLVVVSFVKAYVVDQYHWLDNRAFLDAVAVGIISPGPVVITATFVGYLVGGSLGALAATVGIFLPSIIFTVVGTPILLRYRSHPGVAGFVRGVTVAVVGVLAGTTYLIAKPIITDWITITILGLVIVIPVLKKNIPDQVLVATGAAVGVLTLYL